MGGDGSGDALVLNVVSESFTSDGTDLDINFFDSSRASLEHSIYTLCSVIVLLKTPYKLKDAVINEASLI